MTLSLSVDLMTASATHAYGAVLAKYLGVGDTLLLYGEIGAGKTALTQGLGQGLGITDPIVSPTFALIHEYRQGRLPLYHLDLYRLAPADVAAIAPETYWEGLEVEPGITAIEWAERLPYQPPHGFHLRLTSVSDTQRQAHLALTNPTPSAQILWPQLQTELTTLIIEAKTIPPLSLRRHPDH